MAKHFCNDPAEHNASIGGTKAWNWLKEAKTRTYSEWEKVGKAFLAGRAWAMREAGIPAGINLPKDYRLGRAYNEKFAEWLIAYKLDDIDQADRSNLFKLTDSPAITAWRSGLEKTRRDKLNHPTTILRAYERAEKSKLEPPPEAEAKKSRTRDDALDAMSDKLQSQTEEVAKLRIEAKKRCDVDLLHSDPDAIAKWLRMRVLKDTKAMYIRDVLLELYPLG
jgi:hypothetical protein